MLIAEGKYMWGVEWAVVLAMIGFNSVFAAYEIALTSVSLARPGQVRGQRPDLRQLLVAQLRPGSAYGRHGMRCQNGQLASPAISNTAIPSASRLNQGRRAAEHTGTTRDTAGFPSVART